MIAKLAFALMIQIDSSGINPELTTYWQQKDHCRYMAQSLMMPGRYFIPVQNAYCKVVFVDDDQKLLTLRVKPQPIEEETETPK